MSDQEERVEIEERLERVERILAAVSASIESELHPDEESPEDEHR